MAAREKICHALLELLKEKDVNDITVSELIHLAGVSRSSYYYYFYRPKSILDDMLQDFLKTYAEILDSLGHSFPGGSNQRDAAMRLARHFYEHKTLVSRLFFSNSYEKFHSDLIRLYISALEAHDIYAGTSDAGPLEKIEDASLIGLYAYSEGYAFAGRMEWWARGGFAITPEELLERTEQLARLARPYFARRSSKP